RLGDLLEGKYRVLRVVADGGMGIVFEAHHELLRKSVALKFPLPELAHVPSVAERFLAEARLCARMDNEHVVRILDVSKLNGLPYIVMEFVNGVSLAALLGSPWPPLKAAAFAVQLLEGLEAVHALGVVHRDVKPENVLVVQSAEGEVLKLVDFGVAKDSIPQDTLNRLTRSGALLGTPAYMAPEQIRDAGRAGPGADVYSVGILLFEMLAGCSPFRATTVEELACQALAGDLRSLRELAPDTPQPLLDIVSRATALDAADRFQSASELRGALQTFCPRAEVERSSSVKPASLATPLRHEGPATPMGSEPPLALAKQDAEGRTLAAQVVAGPRRSVAADPDAGVPPTHSGTRTRQGPALRSGAILLGAALALPAVALVLTQRAQTRRARDTTRVLVPAATSGARQNAVPPQALAVPSRTPSAPAELALPSAAPAAHSAASVLRLWNEAHNRHDSEALRSLYADQVEFYGERYALTKVLSVKRQIFQRVTDFEQGSQNLTFTSTGSRIRAEFTKTWRAAGVTKSIGATVAVAPVGGRLRIVEETDDSVRSVAIECGGQRCANVCCASEQAYVCAESAAECPPSPSGESTLLLCDGPEDCREGKVCCMDPADGALLVACTPAEACTGSFAHPRSGTHIPLTTVCHADYDCAPEQRCASTPGVALRVCQPRAAQ
ncbi:MAG TPA: serine/threonine-protein kinase, partial [Polyangiaceae bacterium]|nr:serine/threonine-protein kinase [Polyangiaceae bacterium]